MSRRVRRALGSLLLALPLALPAAAFEQPLAWIAPAGAVDGYRVHVGGAPGAYTRAVDLGAVAPDATGVGRASVTLEAGRDQYVALTAYNAAGESPLSNELRVAAAACDPAACDDANPCTEDACGADGCASAPLAERSACAPYPDALGVCIGGVCTPVECLAAADCNDANACNGAEGCSADGGCLPGTAPSCAGGDACRNPLCDPAAGCVLVPAPDGTSCSDGDKATVGDRCVAGACVGTPKLRKPRGRRDEFTKGT
jgi:hypothetical protein